MAKAKRSQDKTGVYMLAIVGIVVVVALAVAMKGADMDASLTSAAVATGPEQKTTAGHTEWTTCLDNGNKVKLGNKEGGTLAKQDTCTGSAVTGKQIKTVSCVQDIDGDWTYKYANPQDCSVGTRCMKDETGAAYCG